MFLEKRRSGKSVKYYLVHSYRDKGNKVQKIRRYLGANLKQHDIEKLTQRAKELIEARIKDFKTYIFNFSLSEKEIKKLNKYSKKLKIHHLQKDEWKTFTEEFVYNTNAIEGSTATLKEVKDVLRTKKPKNEEEFESEGVAQAIDFIRKTKKDMSLELIKKLHFLCFGKTKSFAGNFRNVDVVIANSIGEVVHRGVPFQHLKMALNEYVSWYSKNKKKFKPLLLAAIIHNQFEHIHPFQDGNGRVGRLLLNFILIKNKQPPINIMLEDRQDYYRTLQMYSKNDEIRPTLEFLIKQYTKTLRMVTTKNKDK